MGIGSLVPRQTQKGTFNLLWLLPSRILVARGQSACCRYIWQSKFGIGSLVPHREQKDTEGNIQPAVASRILVVHMGNLHTAGTSAASFPGARKGGWD